MSKLFTKTGDKGATSLATNQRVLKTDIRIEANGCLDELNALLGFVKTQTTPSIASTITDIQTNIMAIMAAVAGKQVETSRIISDTNKYEADMKQEISNFEFAIPGTSVANALLHILRTKVRTCERRLWQVNEIVPMSDAIMRYTNRLSDYLFYLSREV